MKSIIQEFKKLFKPRGIDLEIEPREIKPRFISVQFPEETCKGCANCTCGKNK